ncbi:MAG TPA: SWIM zinc finger family protein [Telluria sp.]
MLKAEQILGLAPDPASAKAGSQLATPAKWGGLGFSGDALWGECQGSGKTPYRTQIDLSEPAFKCTCPSRKFPCKHGLGLYLLRAAQPALFGTLEAPSWVADWLDGRRDRRERKDEKAAGKPSAQTPEDAAAAAAQVRKREDKREQNIVDGLAELRTWLDDLARDGLATVRARGPGYWETIAARMVDAQAGGLATRLRRVAGLCFQSTNADWENQLSNELAAIYLLSHAYGQLDGLPPPLRCDVRGLVGWTVPQEEVLAQPPVADCWQVLAQYNADEGRIRSRTTWLRGIASGRWALLLQYSAGTQGFDMQLAVGTQFDAALHFYPSAWPLRALVREVSGLREIDAALPAAPSLDAALDDHAGALAAQPFLERYPMLLAGITPDSATRSRLITADGRQLTLQTSFRHTSHLLALSGGHPLTLVGEWDGAGLLPLSVWHDGRLYNIETDFGA